MASPILFIAALICAGIAGLTAALFGTIYVDSPLKMAALPMAILLGIFMVVDRQKLLMLILIFRATVDMFLEATKLSIGPYEIGVGGLLNAFVIVIVFLLVIEKPSTMPKRALTVWAAFLLMAFIGIAIAPETAVAVRRYLGLLSYFAIFVAAFYIVRTPEDFKSCIRVVLWSSAIPALYAIYELVSGNMQGYDGRLDSTFSHPNIFAFYLLLIIPLVFYVLKSAPTSMSTEKRVGLTLYLLLLLAFLGFTRTRSAWFACFMMFAAYGFIFERRYLVYLAVISVFALLLPSVHDRLFDLLNNNNSAFVPRGLPENSFAWRIDIWKAALHWMEPEHYLFGYGGQSFQYYSRTFFPFSNWLIGSEAHNIYVECLFQLGIVGLLTFLWLYGRVLTWLKSMAAQDKLGAFTFLTITTTYMLVGFSDNMLAYLPVNWYFWFAIGAACALVTVRQRAEAGVAPTQQRVSGSLRYARDVI